MNWYNLMPYHIAKQQIAWERSRRIAIAKLSGATFTEIARHLNIPKQTVHALYHKYKNKTSPLSEWLELK